MIPAMTLRAFDPSALRDAVAALSAGSLVAFPTETVYGLGADAISDVAVAKIFAAKGRPQNNPLIVHVADLAMAEAYATFPETALILAARFWPGPMTLVLPCRPNAPLAPAVTAGLATVALRMPQHDIAQHLVRAFGRGIAAPSANRTGHVSATTAAHVANDLAPHIALVLDGGASPLGLESTILAVHANNNATLLRSGHITAANVKAVLSDTAASLIDTSPDTTDTPSAPGQFASHYAPNAAVRLNATTITPGDAVLAFGALDAMRGLETAQRIVNLSATGNLAEAAQQLFASLRLLDQDRPATIAVAPIPDHGIGRAINDRLRRAAAPRSPHAATKPRV